MDDCRLYLLTSLILSMGVTTSLAASMQALQSSAPKLVQKTTATAGEGAEVAAASTESLFGGAEDAAGDLFADQSTESLFGSGASDGSGAFFTNITAEQEQDIIDRAYPLKTAKWDNPGIFVCWEELTDEFTDDRALVQTAIRDTWEASSALRFLDWGQCADASRGIRIAVQDTGPHVLKLGKFVDGLAGGMVLNFTYGIWGRECKRQTGACDGLTRMTAIHEFGHAIGFAHEQNRPDTPDDCSKRKLTQGEDGDDTELTPWDKDSAMNYCNAEYTNNGVLSEFDVFALQQIYGEPQ